MSPRTSFVTDRLAVRVDLLWGEGVCLEPEMVDRLRKTLEMRAEEFFALLDDDYYQGGYADVGAHASVDTTN